MFTPATTSTFAPFKLDVAIRLGWANAASGGAYTLPTQASVVDRLNRACNAAGKRLWLLRKWNWISRPFEITLDPDDPDTLSVAGDLTRYAFPPGIAGPGEGFPQYSSGSGGGAVLRVGITQVNRMHASTPDATGKPVRLAWYPRDVPGAQWSNNPAWGVRVFPTPDTTYTLSVPVRRAWAPLVEDGQALPWPVIHDRLAMLMAVREAQSMGGVSEGQDAALLERDIDEAFKVSVREDKDIKGPLVGYLPEVGSGSTSWRRSPSADECTEADGTPLDWR